LAVFLIVLIPTNVLGEGQPPVAVAYPDEQWIMEDDDAFLMANLSYDPDGYIVSWSWDFGDGQTGNGPGVFHRYDAPGDYTVTLTVTDNDGLTDSDTAIVHVLPVKDMFVNSIDFTKHVSGGKKKVKVMQLDITVKITDDNLDGVPSAMVYGTLDGPDGVFENFQSRTGLDGTVTFEYQNLGRRGQQKPLKPGTYIFTVTNVALVDWNYNPAKNLETSDSISV
jgi:PKD repeat protein